MKHKELFPSGIRHPLVMLGLPVESIAKDLRLDLNEWKEDGLGMMRGFIIELYSELTVLLCESDHGRAHLGHLGPVVYVDALDAINYGYKHLLFGTLFSLSLSQKDVFREPDCQTEWDQSIREDFKKFKSQ